MVAIGAVLAATGVAVAFGVASAALGVLAALVEWAMWRSSAVFVGPRGVGAVSLFGRRTSVPASEIARIDVVDVGDPNGSSDGFFVFVDGEGQALCRVPARERGNSDKLEPFFDRVGLRPTVPEDHSLTPGDYADMYGASVADARLIRSVSTGVLGLIVLAAMFVTATGIFLEITNLRYSSAAACQKGAPSTDCRLTAQANVLEISSARPGSSTVSFFSGTTPVPDATISKDDVTILKLEAGTPATVEIWSSQVTVISANNQRVETSATESTAGSVIVGGVVLLLVSSVVLGSDLRSRRRRFAPMFPPGVKPAAPVNEPVPPVSEPAPPAAT